MALVVHLNAATMMDRKADDGTGRKNLRWAIVPDDCMRNNVDNQSPTIGIGAQAMNGHILPVRPAYDNCACVFKIAQTN